MARPPRVVAVDTPHHVTQRGNGRHFVLESDSDRLVYLDLLRNYTRLHLLRLLGYCLMSNHVHLVVTPQRPESLAVAMRHVHGRYAAYFNARYGSSGHVWQGRYYSCPMDASRFWSALRYVELNPVRAGLAANAADYPWSSAALHCGDAGADGLVDLLDWGEVWTPTVWRAHLAAGQTEQEAESIRRSTHTGRPLGGFDFVKSLEKALQRKLDPGKGGRPRKTAIDARQACLFLA